MADIRGLLRDIGPLAQTRGTLVDAGGPLSYIGVTLANTEGPF